ncbi:MAG: 50S ribosomal protein L10 [Bacteroidia bacterium]|nr:50S ribosomal protein L10 [Bacteroidia bacterium]MCC6768875.1 50S ribosomal protein L10 [Bacteroidia bacterium]
MKKEDKDLVINDLVEKFSNTKNFYLTDTSTLTVAKTNILRRSCFKKNIELKVVKNTLLQKALERLDADYSPLFVALKGTTAVMFTESVNEPAKLIKDFRKTGDRPLLKAAYVEESFYIGDNQLDALLAIKTKNEVIGDIIGLLQSPAKNVVSALQSGGGKLAGIVKTLSERNA